MNEFFITYMIIVGLILAFILASLIWGGEENDSN